MKTFIYFSQGEWRTFQAEELPVKPEFVNFMKVNFSHDKASYECALEKYESEIAALKAKSVKVYNSDILEHAFDVYKIINNLTEEEFHQWPGEVIIFDRNKAIHHHPTLLMALLQLPENYENGNE